MAVPTRQEFISLILDVDKGGAVQSNSKYLAWLEKVIVLLDNYHGVSPYRFDMPKDFVVSQFVSMTELPPRDFYELVSRKLDMVRPATKQDEAFKAVVNRVKQYVNFPATSQLCETQITYLGNELANALDLIVQLQERLVQRETELASAYKASSEAAISSKRQQ